jgi:glyoxylase-like metal-dependent hydrolase (beta-lactamase superfamily II)
VAPNISFNDRMTLHRGGREIQLLFLGRAHTAGDVAIYLPKEKLVFTGDMMLGGVSYLEAEAGGALLIDGGGLGQRVELVSPIRQS